MNLPTVLKLKGPAVVVGAGSVGKRKIEYLQSFCDEIIVIDAEQRNIQGVKFTQASVSLDNIAEIIPDNASLVVSALSNNELNAAISKHCQAAGILVNVVDDPPNCTVYFPAFSKSGSLVISISTDGKAPFIARKIREEHPTSLATVISQQGRDIDRPERVAVRQ